MLWLFRDHVFVDSEASRRRNIIDNTRLRNLIGLSTSQKAIELSALKENASNMEAVLRFYGQCRKQKKVVESHVLNQDLENLK